MITQRQSKFMWHIHCRPLFNLNKLLQRRENCASSQLQGVLENLAMLTRGQMENFGIKDGLMGGCYYAHMGPLCVIFSDNGPPPSIVVTVH